MAHKKAGGSSRNGRDSEGRRLGVKKFGGEQVAPGNIILRQRGTQWHPGEGVGIGRDHTIFAEREGVVEFKTKARGRTYVSVRSGQARVSGDVSREDPFPFRGERPVAKPASAASFERKDGRSPHRPSCVQIATRRSTACTRSCVGTPCAWRRQPASPRPSGRRRRSRRGCRGPVRFQRQQPAPGWRWRR